MVHNKPLGAGFAKFQITEVEDKSYDSSELLEKTKAVIENYFLGNPGTHFFKNTYQIGTSKVRHIFENDFPILKIDVEFQMNGLWK